MQTFPYRNASFDGTIQQQTGQTDPAADPFGGIIDEQWFRLFTKENDDKSQKQ